ncbi:glycoside hydrolase family 20 protein [Patellaria atrata CBS 101060]|uniref:Beta-hexosaminidase n=1 Tax=Patellaria atrata CBS 101060 TaxID=1346257 RepID=A0A9P4S5Z1_9PEZI|nr:glycoside hydrolase family 20 protein [Patellaria atrata CBS 101060]
MKILPALSLLIPVAVAIWPLPKSYTSGDTVLFIEDNVHVTYNGVSSHSILIIQKGHGTVNSTSPSTASEIVQTAIQRTYETLFSKNFIPWKFHPRNSDFEPSTENKKYITSITLTQTAADPENIFQAPVGEVDESYFLSLIESGKVTIKAKSSIGLARGLTTFTQLFFKHTEGCVYTTLAPVEISDEPKFAHRGINMDTARNYFDVDDIKRIIDAAAYNKFNRFHIHITDSQSWPLVIPSMPDLATKGAYRKDLVYTPEQVADIQRYGGLLGVQVFLEIDMPGHTSSIWFSRPELITAFNEEAWDTYAAEPPSGTLKLNSTEVYDFLDEMLDDLLPRLSPYTGYFHSGGDEVNIQAYLLDETVRSNDTAVLQPLMEKFVQRNHDQIREKGLTPIVWEEMLLTWNVSLGKDVIVQTWQSDEAVAAVTEKGYKALVGNYNYWYLDCGNGQWLDFPPSSSEKYWPYNDYCFPRHNWRVMYSYDPLHGVPPEAHHLVVGGEAHIWAEQTDPVNIDNMVWPRACAAAEVLWSGAKDETGGNRSQTEASPRLSEMRERLVARGVMAHPIQMPYCIMNGTQCGLDH